MTLTPTNLLEGVARALCAINFAKNGCEGEFGTVDDCWWSFVDEAQAIFSHIEEKGLVLLQGWQPIKTAPKNRTIDLWVVWSDGDARRKPDSFWNDAQQSWQVGNFCLSQFMDKGVRATHWMLPPPAPAALTQESER